MAHSVVYLFAVSDARDIHRFARVIDGIHDAVIARANPPAVPVAMQLFAAGWTRTAGEFADLWQQPRDHVRRQTASLQFAECAKFGFHLIQRGTRLLTSRLRYGSILDVLGQQL